MKEILESIYKGLTALLRFQKITLTAAVILFVIFLFLQQDFLRNSPNLRIWAYIVDLILLLGILSTFIQNIIVNRESLDES